MDIEEIIARKTFQGYVMLHLQQKRSPLSRWQIIFDEGGIDRHQGFAASEEEARGKIVGLIEGKKTKTPRYAR